MIFGLSFEKVLIIAVIAAFLIGPQKLPEYAAALARLVRRVRQLADTAQERVRDEMGPDFDDVDWKKLDPRQYDPRRIIRDALTEEWDATTPEPSGATAASRVAEDAEDDASAERRPTTAGATGARDVAYDDEAT